MKPILRLAPLVLALLTSSCALVPEYQNPISEQNEEIKEELEIESLAE